MVTENNSDTTHRQVSEDDPISIFVASTGARFALKVIIWLFIIAIAITTARHYWLTHQLSSPIIAAALPMLVFVLFLLRAERLKLAFSIFIWGLAIFASTNAFLISGMQTPALMVLPITTILAGWLLGRRQGLLLLVFDVVMLVVIAYAQSSGHLPAVVRSPEVWAITYMTVCVIGSIFGIVMTGSGREHFRKARQLNDELTRLNAELELAIAKRTADLSNTLTHLKQTQDDLIQSEKLASLGSMVAGISHELNTPLGNALLMATSLCNNFRELEQLLRQDALKRSALVKWQDDAREMAQLCERSISRATSLVTSFKKVATDQTSERRRIFDLHDSVEDILATLRPGIKHAPWVLINNIPANIECDSFPGPLGQIITNLVQNAILHGFEGRSQGQVTIDAKADHGRVDLSVTDDGIGMASSTLAHIFDPFFTTKMGKGGSGLGLAICYRIATTILAGEIHASSSYGDGTRFVLSMPQRVSGGLQ